jgi:hypothetical protein
MTLSKMTLSIMTLGIMTLDIMTLDIMTLSSQHQQIKCDTQHNGSVVMLRVIN